MRDELLLAANDNKECQSRNELWVPVCTSCWCYSEWVECEYAGICPHSYEDDSQFSSRCLNAYLEMKTGKYKSVGQVANANGVSAIAFLKYKRAKGLEI